MEVMEEGNLMDRIPILLQRDLQYYQENQCILQESICPGVVGGKLDFPRYASFASIKIVAWWEEEFYAAYRKHSGLLHTNINEADFDTSTVIKNSDPDKFVNLITKSADLLLEHLHSLTQESLDHADLSVLTATIGATALIKNCLKVYLDTASTKHYPPRGDETGGSLKLSYKKYAQMTEALAERLQDLHCRLLLLYIIQDADCLYWEDEKPFFESERGSYTIQMWWHYMRGTKDDLWNSVPPRMAQRIIAGMLNETLSVLTMRYSHIITSTARSQQHLVDICNLLFCVSELLPSVCKNGDEYIGLHPRLQSITVRDIHAKCRELFYCLLLRGAPLAVLSKVIHNNKENLDMYESRHDLPSAWITFVLPRFLFKDHQNQHSREFSQLDINSGIALELKILLSFPQADWPFLTKVLLNRDAKLLSIILPHLMKNLPSPDNFKDVAKYSYIEPALYENCGAFLCRHECFDAFDHLKNSIDPVGLSNCQVVLSLTFILVSVGKATDIKACLIDTLEMDPTSWCDCLDKRQIWNQKRPPWLEGIVHIVYPLIEPIIYMLINAVENGAHTSQAISLSLIYITEMWESIPDGLYKVTQLLQDIISVSTKSLGDSVLVQIIFTALYTHLVKKAADFEKNKQSVKSTICFSLSEAICTLDENNTHLEQIHYFLKEARPKLGSQEEFLTDMGLEDLYSKDAKSSTNSLLDYPLELDVESAEFFVDILASDILSSSIGRQSLKVTYTYLRNNRDWLFEQLGAVGSEVNEFQAARGQCITNVKTSTLKSMFYIGNTTFDQLLTGALKVDYLMWLQMPISLNPERAWLQIQRRCDFQENSKLSIPEVTMVVSIKNVFQGAQSDI